jgi:hypothetical protein
MIGSDGEENVPHADWLRTFNLVVDQFKKEHPDFFGAKVFFFLSRAHKLLSAIHSDNLLSCSGL